MGYLKIIWNKPQFWFGEIPLKIIITHKYILVKTKTRMKRGYLQMLPLRLQVLGYKCSKYNFNFILLKIIILFHRTRRHFSNRAWVIYAVIIFTDWVNLATWYRGHTSNTNKKNPTYIEAWEYQYCYFFITYHTQYIWNQKQDPCHMSCGVLKASYCLSRLILLLTGLPR